MINANRKTLRITAAAVAAGAVAAAGATLATSWTGIAHASGKPASTMAGMAASGPTTYQFTTLDNANDLTFNQLLGINNENTIAGYFGSGAAGHPNKGYLLLPPYGQGSYRNENFPGSVQTQVTGLNDNGVTVGFWSTMNTASMNNNNFGFYRLPDGSFHEVVFPTGDNANPVMDQLLGVNDHDVAVGFYVNGGGLSRAYTYNIETHVFTRVQIPGYPTSTAGPSTTAAAINNNGDIAGFYTDKAGVTVSFLDRHGSFTTLAVPGASATSALGVNDHDEVVGDYTVGTGSAAVMHGFTWTPGGGFATVDDPDGMGTTTINGVNDAGDLVGFYVDGNGNTDGFLARPVMPKPVTTSLQLMSMPQGTATLGRDSEDDVDVTIDAFGLTPGSAHNVELVNGAGGVVADFSMLTANTLGQADATLDSGYKGALGAWRVVILNGTAGDSVSTEPIAETSPYMPGMPGTTSYQLTAVEVGPDGTSFGTPAGSAVITYNPKAQTISVTVNASGVTPGPHAAHIHVGSCQSQGSVQYMLADFIANPDGQIVHETRTVTDVTSPLPATGWYLNLHQGDMNNILSNGSPTINFRPLLCGDIVTNG